MVTSHAGYMNDDLPKSRVAEIRRARGLKSAQLSRSSGIQPPTLSKIERGERGVTKNMAPKLAKALQVDLPELYADLGAPVPAPAGERLNDAAPSEAFAPGSPEDGELKKKRLKTLMLAFWDGLDGDEQEDALTALVAIARFRKPA